MIGRTCTIRPAYSSETGERSIWDEIAGMSGVVLRVRDDDTADVRIGDEEYNVHLGRLRFREPS